MQAVEDTIFGFSQAAKQLSNIISSHIITTKQALQFSPSCKILHPQHHRDKYANILGDGMGWRWVQEPIISKCGRNRRILAVFNSAGSEG